ncbi:MAG TPA: hypothetical protein VIU61_20950 [Kofleriaceae bacterium]
MPAPSSYVLWIATLGAACSDSSDAPVDASASVDATGDAAIDAPAACASLGVTWEPVGDAPILGDGTCPGWHCAGVADPALARAPDGSLVLWFTTVGVIADGNGGFVAKMNIGRATGADAEHPVLALSPDHEVLSSPTTEARWDRHAETVSVAHDAASSRWMMWYLGYREPGFVGAAIGQMQSLDANGTSWTRPAAPIYQPTPGGWDSALVTGPTGLRGPDGVWRVYYSGVGLGGAGVGLLMSTDGVTFTPAANPVFPSGGATAWDETVLEQTVRYAHGKYWMLYSAYVGPLDMKTTSIAIGLATSIDGVTWERHPANPVLRPGLAGTWNDLRVLAPDLVIEPDGSFLLAAYGQSTTDPTSDQPGRTALWRSRCPN